MSGTYSLTRAEDHVLVPHDSLENLAAEINALHEKAQQSATSALDYAYQCGQKLIESKAQCKHGEWLPWLKANSSLSPLQRTMS